MVEVDAAPPPTSRTFTNLHHPARSVFQHSRLGDHLPLRPDLRVDLAGPPLPLLLRAGLLVPPPLRVLATPPHDPGHGIVRLGARGPGPHHGRMKAGHEKLRVLCVPCPRFAIDDLADLIVDGIHTGLSASS